MSTGRTTGGSARRRGGGGLRVAMVSEHASPLAALGGEDAGGQNVHVANLAAHLARAGHRVTVHTRRDDEQLPDVVPLAAGLRVHHVAAGPACPIAKDDLWPWMGRFADRLVDAWRDDPPDVVHAHFWMSGCAALAAATALDLPVVQTFHALGTVKQRHQGAADASPPVRIEAERRLGRACDRIVATCSDEVFELVALGADPTRLEVVPCGVDTTHFRPEGPVAARSGRPRLLVVGRLVERKGLADVVLALRDVPEAELVVAGGRPVGAAGADDDLDRIRALARQVGVEGRVVLLGAVERAELPALFRSADVVVCVPWYEPFGIVPLEAMACGVPVVASAVGGLVDTVLDGRTGCLVRPRDPDGLAATLRGLLADVGRRRAMGAAGVVRARGRYAWPRVAAETEGVYRSVLASRSRRAIAEEVGS